MTAIAVATANRMRIVESIVQATLPAAETILAGAPVRIDSNGKFANGNATTPTEAGIYGIATGSVIAGEVVTAVRQGVLDGYTLAGAYNSAVYLSDTDATLDDAGGTFRVGTVIPGWSQVVGTAADKLLYVDAGGWGGLATVETVAATNVLTAGESGKTLFLAHATEFATTLPEEAAGLEFTFIVGLAPASASYTVVTAGTTQNTIHGVNVSAADAGGAAGATAGTPVDVITFVDGQAGVGDGCHLICDGALWYAQCWSADEDAITFS